jgi:hypothetical protein
MRGFQIDCISIFLFLLLLLSPVIPVAGLTDLDYHLGKSKYGEALVSEEESFHGDNSAELSVSDKGDYIRITVYLDEPLPLNDLNYFSMWMNPQKGDGKVQLEFFLDGDEDDSYNSDSLQDARLRSIRKAWSEIDMSSAQWNELDGFDLNYEKYNDKAFGIDSLENCQSRLRGEKIVRIYITLYKDANVPETSAFIDYIKIGDQILSFEPLETEEIKNAPHSVSPGSQITYTITYGNNLLEPTDLVVREQYDPRTFFVQAFPEPDFGTTNVWTFRHLPPGAHGQIVIKLATIKPSCRADFKGEVSGIGYTAARGLVSTDFPGYDVTNHVTITSGELNLTASATTGVKPIEGSILAYDDHGSGKYHATDVLGYSPSRILVSRDLNASWAPTTFDLPLRQILFQDNWHAGQQCENKVREVRWKERYYQSNFLNLSSRTELGKYLSYVNTQCRFDGLADRSFQGMDGEYDQRFSGNFTINSKTRAKWTRMHQTFQDPGLECCSEEHK